MVEQAGALPGEAETSLADPRAQFVASLGRRMEALRQALFALEQTPKSGALRDHLRRRIHAFGSAAGVLGFDRVFEAFREAETVLGRAGAAGLSSTELALVSRTIDLVPSLVLGAGAPSVRDRDLPGPRGAPSATSATERRGGAWPISALAFGAATLVESFEAAPRGGPTVEWERTEDAGLAEEIVRVLAPDVAVVDADRPGAIELIETLAYDPLLDPVRVVAIGTFDRPEAGARLVALGVARVLPRPVSPETLKRSVLQVARERVAPAARIEPVGDVSVEALAERLSQEMRRGLVDALKAQGRGVTVSLGEGTDVLAAVWSSVARVRELVTLRSGGTVRFEPTGPEGAIPLSPIMGGERSSGGGETRSAEGVILAGRTIVVADDDPSVVWFLSGLLRAAGAEVLEAHDGDRALDLVRHRWPDLVVSDILMPGLDGFALCREIKRDIALADIPVILLSWKDDLLQRVRELGADADGYLRKEATSSAVVQRLREVLLPRARVEARLAAGGEARGRLDGLTPRLILTLCCRPESNVHVTMRDAAYLYEIDVRGGRVRSATRTTADGGSERGERALSGLLGVRAGRFAVRRDESPCPMDWDAELAELIAESVLRARSAQRLLSDPTRVTRMEIDEGMLAPYLAATPKSAAALVRRLSEGASPAEVLTAGASQRLLESVLVDLVLHGAVARILDAKGDDLLAQEMAALREHKPSAPPPPPVSIPEARAEQGSPPVADADFAFALLGDSIVPPASGGEARPAGGEKREPSRSAFKALAPPTSAPAEPSPLEVALRSLPSPIPVPARIESLARGASSPPPKVEAPPAVSVEAPHSNDAAPAAPAPVAPVRLKVDLTQVMAAVSLPESAAPSALASKVEETPAAEASPGIELGDAVLSAIGDDSPAEARPVATPSAPTSSGEAPPSTVPTLPPQRAASARNRGDGKGGPGQPETNPRKSGASEEKENRGVLGLIAVVAIGAIAGYSFINAISGASDAPKPAATASVAPAPAPPPRPSVQAPPTQPTTRVVKWDGSADLDLPSGIAVPPDRGLLEIDVGAPYALFVDGVAIGAGPVRQLPLAPGRHEVHVQGERVDSTSAIEVRTGRRARLRMTIVE